STSVREDISRTGAASYRSPDVSYTTLFRSKSIDEGVGADGQRITLCLTALKRSAVHKALEIDHGAVAVLYGTVLNGNQSGVLILDRKSTRLNSSHVSISYAVFGSKKKTGEI